MTDPRIIVAIDTYDLQEANVILDQLDPVHCRIKIGSVVFNSLGKSFLKAVSSRGFKIFLDLKLHDIPNTVHETILGFHDCSIDMFEWEKLDDATRELVTVASKAVNMEVLSMFQAANDSSYQKLINEHGVQMRQLPDEVMNALGQRAGEVCSSIASEDPVSQELFSHIVEFRSSILRWTNTSEREYMRVRSLPFAYPSA